jgi:NitT/TauT family transport system substrate-binding protein
MKNRIALFLSLAVTFAALFFVAGCHKDSATKSNKPLVFGTNKAIGVITPYVGKTAGIFAKHGLEIQGADFNDGPAVIDAMASGGVDIGLFGIGPVGIWQSKGLPLKIVAGANGGGHVLITRADAGINTLADLKGRKVAVPKPGSVTDALFRAHILGDLATLDPEKDLFLIQGIGAPDMATALFVTKNVDAAIAWEPFVSRAEAAYKDLRVLYDASAEWRKDHPTGPYYPVNVVVVKQSLIDERPDDLRKFLAAYKETVAFINDHADQANDLIAAELKVDKAVVVAARRRIDYTWQIDPEAAIQTLQWAKQVGYIKQVPDKEKLFDLRFVSEAK